VIRASPFRQLRIPIIRVTEPSLSRHRNCSAASMGLPRRKENTLLILIIILILVLGGGGGFYGHSRWGYGGGAGIGLGTILLILLIAYLLGGFR
jgi:hypothetical protein